MNLFSIAWKSIRQRALASSLTSLSVALGIMLMVSVLVIYGIVERLFTQRSIGYDLIVGPRGSDLQLVLSSVYRISDPIENVPYLYYLELKNHPKVEVAVPIALGDNTKQEEGGFPIVGTLPEYFTTPYAPPETRDGEPKKFRIRGHGFRTTLDAIIGSEVAETNDWDLGAEFQLVHSGQEQHVHDEKFKVVGILAPTGTPNDKTVFVHLEGFYGIADHGKPYAEAKKRLEDFYGTEYTKEAFDKMWQKPEVRREVTSIFIRAKRPPGEEWMASYNAKTLEGEINQGYRALAVNPIDPMQRLMDDVVGNVRLAVVVLTGLIIAVSGVSIFVSIYNSMSDRRKEIAVMRALGARRQTVFSIILAESTLLCLGGGVLGIVLGHLLVFAASPTVAAKTGLIVDPLSFEPAELFLLPALAVMGLIAGYIPGMTAYRTDVARVLSD